MNFRLEHDSLGSVKVPADAYYGAQTQRAVENFPLSRRRFPAIFIESLALIKQCAARINGQLGLLSPEVMEAIVLAAKEVMDGRFEDQFVVDVFQTGSGTSTNMNMNEVIAGRANEIITGRRGGKAPVHPNDHVNLGQSSNDVIPSTIHVAALRTIRGRLIPGLKRLEKVLEGKAAAFKDILKIGRTHLQDAVPMTLGNEFSGYARQVHLAVRRIRQCESSLSELALGGTAVGTGVNAHPEFTGRVIEMIAKKTGCPFREAVNHFEAQAAQDAAVETSGALKTVAVSLIKIANDIRWLGSGPRCGLGEIRLPSLQPGSSIMPGKVNPVIPEAVIQASVQVIANDSAVSLGGQGGFFELNTMLPLIADNLLESISLLANASELLADRCLNGIEADRDRCAAMVEQSLALATYLVPFLGYDRAAAVAKKAYAENKTIPEIVAEEGLLTAGQIEEIFAGIKKGER